VRAFQQGANAVIETQDSGIGIREDQLPYIFDPFYRGDEARTTSERGTGLGLAIALKIIELHSGTIEAESEIDNGSLIRVTLPVVAFR
jgi:signal transduction histidine kinase